VKARTNAPGATVVKLGGSLLEQAEPRRVALGAIARCWESGGELVVVHGGGERLDLHLATLGIPRRVHDGLRITDERTLEAAVAVLAGVVNKSIVSELRALGVASAGISGADGATLVAEKKPSVAGVDLGHVGCSARGRAGLLRAILAADMLPVVAPIAAGREGGLLNLNADEAAAAVASALAARRLVFFTDVEGVRDETGRTLAKLEADEAEDLLSGPAVEGGMRPKLRACLTALRAGVAEVVIAGPRRHAGVLRDGLGGTSLVAA
jgi:acetylglutamate kinase